MNSKQDKCKEIHYNQTVESHRQREMFKGKREVTRNSPIRLTTDLLATMEARRQWDDSLKVLEKKSRILFFETEGEIRTFLDKQKLLEFISSISPKENTRGSPSG